MSVAAASAPAPTRLPLSAWAKAAVVAMALVAVYARTWAELWRTWLTNDNYSHGPLVPLTAGALLWWRWSRLRGAPVRPTAWGFLPLTAGCAAQVLGVRADVFAVQGWSLLLVLTGLALALLGTRITRLLALPIGYLAFMLTFPPVVMNQLSYALKEIAVGLATGAAEALGVTLQRSGMSLYLATGVLRVENPCSGLRSLLALVATGTLFAWSQPGGGWRRGVMLAAAVPIAILGNVVRLLLLIVVAHYGSMAWATGAFHDTTGYVLYAVSLGAMLLLRRLLTPRAAAAGPVA